MHYVSDEIYGGASAGWNAKAAAGSAPGTAGCAAAGSAAAVVATEKLGCGPPIALVH